MFKGSINHTFSYKITFPNASLEMNLKAKNVVISTFHGLSYEHYLYSFLCRKRKHLLHQYLHVYGLPFSVHKIVYI